MTDTTAVQPLRVMVLISGSGSNLQALIEAQTAGLPIRILSVLSNEAAALGLERARQAGIAAEVLDHRAFPSREEYDAALAACIDRVAPELILLAGFMRILTPALVERYRGRMLNIHPSLLPHYRGLHTHQRALEAGEREHGASVHFVTPELDGGPVIVQAQVPVYPEDDAATLAARVLAREHRIYPMAVDWFARGRLRLGEDGQVWLDGAPLTAPVQLPWTGSADRPEPEAFDETLDETLDRDEDFASFALAEPLARGLAKAGFTRPTPVQRTVIPLALAGLDLLVGAATGSGKTAAFLLPMMQRFIEHPRPDGATRGLVVVPTRELARQVLDHFLQLGSYSRLQAGVLVGGERRGRQITVLRRNPHLLIGTPGRLRELLDLGELALGDLEVLVLDEADRMLDLGLADDALALVTASAATRQTLLLSATIHHRGLTRLIGPALREPRTLLLDPVRAAHPDIRHACIPSDDDAHKRRQLLWLLEHEPAAQVLVFLNTRERATALAGFLYGSPQRVALLHGELDQVERKRVMALFRAGQARVLIATDVAARGLDIPGVECVINFDVPRRGEDYLHRSGRTGRAGAVGIALTLVEPDAWNRLESIARYLRIELETRALPGLAGRFQWPEAPRRGARKPPPAQRQKAQDARTPDKPKPKERLRDRKNIGKRRQPSGTDAGGTDARAGQSPPAKAPVKATTKRS